MRIVVVALVCVGLSSALFSQTQTKKYWIYFTSKTQPAFAKSASEANVARAFGISERALKRRAKVTSSLLSEEDIPVSQTYIQQIEQLGVRIENESRWFNSVTAYLTPDQQTRVAILPFVKEMIPVRTFRYKKLPPVEGALQKSFSPTINQKYNYGPSLTQMQLINSVAVHNIGITGRGVLVGMLDTGFRWKTHEALQKLNVIAEYDFINKDSITANEANDASGQDSHGTSTMSLVGGFKDSSLVSPAFNANFILGKTEYVPSETNIEEDNWVAAIEWMEQNGVDVVSSSLGYSEFDAGQKSYVYADMNGRTATTTKAAAIAARKGVVVCNAMGNEAQTSWHFLTSPADADSIISVGAVSSSGNVASFSSVGPTSDGRTKPDVSSHGVGTYCASPGKAAYYSPSGTSMATPLTAGVAAQILSAHPELTPIQVRDALRNTASNAKKPNNSIGWGIIDAYKAILYNGMVISTDAEIVLNPDSNYSIGMFVVSSKVIFKDSVKLFFSTNNGITFTSAPMILSDIVDSTTNSGKYIAIIPKQTAGAKIRFYVSAVDSTNKSRKSPFNAPTELFDIATGLTTVIGKNIPTAFVLQQNYPNPFNPSTVISYQIPVTNHVSLKVYDVLGREVATLVNEMKDAGKYEVKFSASRLSSGIYFYRLRAGNVVETKKMMLTK